MTTPEPTPGTSAQRSDPAPPAGAGGPDSDTEAPHVAPSRRRVTLAILALALGGFGIGVTEFAAMGLLRPIAEGFGITEPEAGHIISAYALGVVVGAPLLTVAAARMRRRHLLLVLMAMFVVGNAAGAFAPDQTWLIAARFVAGIPHGAYFGVASWWPRRWPARAGRPDP